MKCPRCQQENPPQAKFCHECGASIDRSIPIPTSHADLEAEIDRLKREVDGLRRSLGKAVEQQTATSEILRVISSSPTDVQPVFDAILSSAMGLMGAFAGALTRVSGDQLQLAACKGSDPRFEATLRTAFPRSLEEEGSHADAVRRRAAVNIRQAQSGPEGGDFAHAIAQAEGYQSMVVVPLLHHDIAVGTIAVARRKPGALTDSETSPPRTCAAQAAAPIETVRLFNETKEARAQPTATTDILRAITSSPAYVQPVFKTIAERAVRPCEA